MTSPHPILPGATVGVLGCGQLGRMFAIAARRMGYRVHTLSPDTDTPTGQVADVEITAAYDDLDAVRASPRRGRRDVRVRERPRRHRRRRGRVRARPPGRARAAHHPAPPAREDVPRDARLSRHALPRRSRPSDDLRRPRCASSARRPCSRPPASATTARGRSKHRLRRADERPPDRSSAGRRVDATKRSSTSTARSRSSPPRGVDGAFAHWGVDRERRTRNHILDLVDRPGRRPAARSRSEAIEIARGVLEAARRRRRPLRRVLPHQVRQPARQRARPPAAQLRPPHLRRLP